MASSGSLTAPDEAYLIATDASILPICPKSNVTAGLLACESEARAQKRALRNAGRHIGDQSKQCYV